jgi:hypothetical protein
MSGSRTIHRTLSAPSTAIITKYVGPTVSGGSCSEAKYVAATAAAAVPAHN